VRFHSSLVPFEASSASRQPPQPGRPRYPFFFIWVISFDVLGMKVPANSYATAGVDVRVRRVVPSEISGFRSRVDEAFALLGYYAT
jgi:hypothetical protein